MTTLTIVVPVLDRDEPLRRCVASIFGGTRSDTGSDLGSRFGLDVDVVVLDDGSAEDYAAIVDEIAASSGGAVQVVHRPNRGPSAARNAGLGFAAGEYVMFLDSDDELTPDGLDHVVGALAGDGIGMACFATSVVGADGSARIVRPSVRPGITTSRLSELSGSFVVRTSVALSVGGYDAALRYGENTDFILRLADECVRRPLRVIASDRLLAIYHERPGRRRYDAERLDAAVHLLRRGRFDLAIPGERAKLHGIAAVNAARLARYGLALHHAADAVRAQPANPRHIARLAMVCTGPFARRRWLAE